MIQIFRKIKDFTAKHARNTQSSPKVSPNIISIPKVILSTNRHFAILLFSLMFNQFLNAQEIDSVYFGNIKIISDSIITNDNFSKFIHQYQSQLFHEENYNSFTKRVLQIPNQSGFLFPSLSLKKIYPKFISDSLFINPEFYLFWGSRIKIDTLFFGNIEKTSDKLLHKDLKSIIGKNYSDQTNSHIKQNLKKYSFLQYNNNSEIVKTSKGKYGLLINLQEKQANLFGGIVGYVPKTSGKDGYFTGQLDIDLKNINGMGRGVNIFWSKVNDNSQELKLNYFEPHLLKSQIFTNIGFNQTLRDTLVVIRNLKFGFGQNLSNKGIIELTGNWETTLPTPSGRDIFNLEDSKIFKAGLKYSYDNRDLASNPSKGIYINTHNFIGFHERQQKQKLMTQTKFYGEINYSISKNLVINLRSTYEGKFIKNSTIDFSDQLWFGGTSSLRGYPEDFFSGSEFGIIGSELRWITGYYSRIFVFIDQGLYKNMVGEIYKPFSFGVGMRLESRMGTIGIDYAFGENDTFTTAKIHIHLENRF